MAFASLPPALALALLWLNRAAPPPLEAAAPFGLPLAGVGGTPAEPVRPPPGPTLDARDFSIERWPRPSAAAAAAAAALRRAIDEGRLARAPDWKVAPKGYRVTLGHMAVCTSCWQRAYRRSLHARPFAPARRAWQLLIDEHGVRSHRCAVRVAEPPSKTWLNLSCPGDCDDRGDAHAREVARAGQYGFYGSVLKLPDGKLHMWLGENQAWHARSVDGVRWSRPTPVRRTAAVAPANLCVSHDAARGRLLLGHDCGNIDGQQSACIATSSDRDGLRWAPAGAQPRPVARADDCAAIGSCCCGGCESHADSTNCVRYDAAARAYVLTKRQAFASARGRSAARLWREIRGVRFSTAADLLTPAAAQCGARGGGGGAARPAFTPRAEWYLDRTGKSERFERQIYALSLGALPEAAANEKRRAALSLGALPEAAANEKRRASASARAAAVAVPADALRVGVLTLLNWPKFNSTVPLEALDPPYSRDTVSAYLLPSRDGVTFDLDAVYAGTPAIPHGGCAAGARGGLGADGAEGRCAPDHAYVQPATELLTHQGRHWLYYEARPITHQHRWRVPAKIGVARWPLHRLASVRADPRCAAPGARAAAGACGAVLTRPFAMPAGVRAVVVNGRGGGRAGAARGGLRVELVRAGGATLALHFGAGARADALHGDEPAARARVRQGGGLGALAGVQVQLRFEVCGDSALFAWRLE